jgi:Skp family chaperone for outer membrane proteins
MKTHLFTAAALALTAAAASPAAAQVGGIAVADPAIAVAGSQTLQTAYSQISQTFQAQRTQLEGLQTQRDTLVRQFDTDGDGQLSDAEQAAAQANTTVRPQVEALDQQIAQVQGPITAARIYAMEQILQQFNPALQQVIADRAIQLILTPEAAVYVAEAVDVTDEIMAAISARVPTVSTAVPQGWQPQRQTVNMYQEVQQILLSAAIQQQAAAQQQQGQPQQPVEGR